MLNATRHHQLAAIHPRMPMVPRRKLADAKPFLSRGEPVVITDLFGDQEGRKGEGMAHPVPQKWTLDYLRRRVFGIQRNGQRTPTLNVAAGSRASCCQYYEPRRVSIEKKYPYPFRPSTHLYLDTFEGFAATVCAATANRTAALASSADADAAAPTLHYLHDIVMQRDGAPVLAGKAAPADFAADLAATAEALEPVAQFNPFYGGIANAKLWIGQRGVVMPLHYDTGDNLYVMAWGRKRVLLGEPGQLETLYRYPNAHPHVGTARVNLSAPNLTRHPNFVNAKLQEAIIGPGDVFYLPAWWWHQFEQPFEDTGSLNVWSRETEGIAHPIERDARLRGISLHDHLEAAVSQLVGNRIGVVLEELANQAASADQVASEVEKCSETQAREEDLLRANVTLHSAAVEWLDWARVQPGAGVEVLRSAAELVSDFLRQSHHEVVAESGWPGWQPGARWNLSQVIKLEPELQARCKPALADATFTSTCHGPA